jgi:hypothetical protein
MAQTTTFTDVMIMCPCCGREVRMTARKMRRLSRMETPTHELAIHQLSREKHGDPALTSPPETCGGCSFPSHMCSRSTTATR